MSRIVGFAVRLPHYLPEGDAVTALSTPSEAAGRPFRYVQLAIRGPSGGMLITQHNAALSAPRGGEELQLDVAGARAWRSSRAGGTTYRIVSSDGQWYYVQLSATSSLSADEVLKVIDGLLAE